MWELLGRFEPGAIIGLVAVSGGLLVALVSIVMGTWASTRRYEVSAQLKRDMLAQGLSPEEIERVVGISSENRYIPEAVPVSEVVTKLTEHGVENLDQVLEILPATPGYCDRGRLTISKDVFRIIEDMATGGYEGDAIMKALQALPKPRPTPRLPADSNPGDVDIRLREGRA